MSAAPVPFPLYTAPARTLPDYLPARMVNEFVYCPRLFFYEWVEGVFRESADTLEGSAQRLPHPRHRPAPEHLNRFVLRNIRTQALNLHHRLIS